MSLALKNFFIPHEGNNYHPHILHTKRAVLYSAALIASKCIVVGFTLLLPLSVFGTPDVLMREQERLLELTNDVRAREQRPALIAVASLNQSAELKARDMANNQYFAHEGPDKRTVHDWLDQSGYSYRVAGENLAMGYVSADDIIAAWVKSPPHYRNLIDTDFTEFGAGFESGLYNNEGTIYVTEHFGSPRIAQSPPISANFVETKSIKVENKAVAGEKITTSSDVQKAEAVEVVEFYPEGSFVSWQDRNNGTYLRIKAHVTGPIQSALVYVGEYAIRLLPEKSSSIYKAAYSAPIDSDIFFRTTVLPVLEIKNLAGEIHYYNLSWDHVKVVPLTLTERYGHSRDMLSFFTSIFDVSRGMYIAFAVFFSFALFLNIVIEIRKQHYHIIAQTFAVIFLLFSLSIA